MNTPWLTSAWRNSNSGLPCKGSRLSAEPVMKLSRARTLTSRSSSAAHRWEPMNPAPPETTALGRDALLAANAAIGETQVPHSCRLIDVAPIHDDRPTHQPVYARHVELPELIPFRDKGKRGDIFREAAAAVAYPCVEEAWPDSLVETHSLGHKLRVRANALADPRDLVDE